MQMMSNFNGVISYALNAAALFSYISCKTKTIISNSKINIKAIYNLAQILVMGDSPKKKMIPFSAAMSLDCDWAHIVCKMWSHDIAVIVINMWVWLCNLHREAKKMQKWEQTEKPITDGTQTHFRITICRQSASNCAVHRIKKITSITSMQWCESIWPDESIFPSLANIKSSDEAFVVGGMLEERINSAVVNKWLNVIGK